MPLSNIIAIVALIITTAMGLPDMIVAAISLASTVLALPGSIVAVIQLWQMLKSGHGRHRK